MGRHSGSVAHAAGLSNFSISRESWRGKLNLVSPWIVEPNSVQCCFEGLRLEEGGQWRIADGTRADRGHVSLIALIMLVWKIIVSSYFDFLRRPELSSDIISLTAKEEP